jgi:hypothetical protein
MKELELAQRLSDDALIAKLFRCVTHADMAASVGAAEAGDRSKSRHL